ncbi:MAG: PAS domain-containing protein [Halorientalis sp.]
MDDRGADDSVGPTVRDVFAVTRDSTLVLDVEDETIVDANEAATEFLGYDVDSLLGHRVRSFAAVDGSGTATDLETAIERCLETGENRCECQITRADGEQCWVDISMKRTKLGEQDRIVAALRDAEGDRRETERRQRTAIEAQRRQLQAVFEVPGTFIGILDPDGTLLRGNQLAWEFADADPDDYVGAPFWDGPWFDHDDTLQRQVEDAVEQARDGAVVEFEAVHYDTGGDPHDIAVTISPVTDEDGQVETIVAQGVDITERKERERRLETQRERMQTILGHAPIVLFALDEDGVFTESRGNALQKIGLEPGEANGMDIREVYAESPQILADSRQALQGKTVESNVHLGDLHFHTVYEPIVDDDGTVEQVIGVSRDVTDLRERERELEAWQDRLQTVLDNAPLALYSFDADGTITLSQGRGLELVGLEPGQLEGRDLFEVYHDQPRLLEDYERALDGERFTTVRELGETIFRTWYRPVERDGTISQVIAVSIDITEQKRQERRIEAISEATSELITADSKSSIAAIVIDLATDLLDMELSTLYTSTDDRDGLWPVATTEEILSMTDATTASEALPRIERGTVEMDAFEAGETRVIEEYASVENKAVPESSLGTVVIVPLGEYGQLHVGTHEIRDPSKAEVGIIEILARNAEAALERAEHEAELDGYRQELEESNERLQQFAYIASHDLQEPLRMVSSYVDLLAMEYGDELDEEADEYIEFAVDGAARMQSMIEDLLQYSRVQTKAGEFLAVETATVVEETLRNLELAIEDAGATVTVESLPAVQADRNQLGQVFQNLVSNALEHGGEEPSVTIRGVETDDDYRFEVEDDGPGIPENQHERIFKIFQQGSRDTDSGTGIGLAVCERIVSRHGGDIWIESIPGEGSTFCFTIPKVLTEDDTMHTAGETPQR